MKTLHPQTDFPIFVQYAFNFISFVVFLLTGYMIAVCIALLTGELDTGNSGNSDFTIESIVIPITLLVLIISLALYNFSNIWKYIGWIFIELGVLIWVMILHALMDNMSHHVELFNERSVKSGIIGVAELVIGLIIITILGKRPAANNRAVEYVESINNPKPPTKDRIIATLVDYIVFFIFVTLSVAFFGEVEPSPTLPIIASKHSNGASLLMSVIFWFLYFPLMESITGQTMGKAMLGLHVVKENNNLHSLRVALFRRLFDLFEMMSLGVVSICLMKFTKTGKRLGDYVAGSRVLEGPYQKVL